MLAVGAFASSSNAQEKPAVPASGSISSSEQNEWSKGVSADDKAQARTLLGEGNTAFANDRFKEAYDKYEAALGKWDHPAIAFNAVRALVQLDRSVEAFDMLERSLRFGKAPLSEDVHREALNYQRLLSNLVAAVEVRCSQSVAVTFDGESISCPGKRSFRVKPGRHVVAGSQPGFVSINQVVTLASGANDPVNVSLVTVAAGIETKTRFATWKPWAVVAAGSVILAAGVGLKFSASSLNNDFAAAAREKCSTACTPEQLREGTLGRLDQDWRTRDKIAIATLAVGGATLLGGALFLFINRPYSVEKKRAVALIPHVDGTMSGMAVTGQF
jgi:tetratricopeptide (TPR) repeat protein